MISMDSYILMIIDSRNQIDIVTHLIVSVVLP